MNKILLVGRLGKDPEVSYLPDGTMVVKTTLATSNDYKKGDNWVKKPASWHTLVAFGGFAEQLAEYRKGDKLEVEGKIQYRQWEDKGGVKHISTEIVVFKVSGDTVRDSGPDNDDPEVPF